MREPSIHITKSTLIGILHQLDIDVDVNTFMKLAKGKSITSRSFIANTKKQLNTLEKISTGGNTGDSYLLADIIYACRIKLKHIGVKKIKQSDTQWPHLKTLVPLVNEYCEAHDMPYREGYIEFVNTGLQLMKESKKVNYAFTASWLYQRFDNIISLIDSNKTLNSVTDMDKTIEFHNIYIDKVADNTGVYYKYLKDKVNMEHFHKARLEADKYQVEYEHYIDAQFYALEFCNGIPRISDLYSGKAIERLMNYLSKFNISLTNSSNKIEVDWAKLKQINNDE